jgi:hypothetical protein
MWWHLVHFWSWDLHFNAASMNRFLRTTHKWFSGPFHILSTCARTPGSCLPKDTSGLHELIMPLMYRWYTCWYFARKSVVIFSSRVSALFSYLQSPGTQKNSAALSFLSCFTVLRELRCGMWSHSEAVIIQRCKGSMWIICIMYATLH